RLLDRIAEAAGEAVAGATVRTVGRRRGVSDRIGDLDGAIARRRIVVLDYYSQRRDEASRRAVRPYGIAQEDGAWYLVAHCERDDAVRTFRIDRIRRVEPTSRAFPLPDGLDWRGTVSSGLYRPSRADRTVRLRLGTRLETWAREHLPAGSLRRAPGGAFLHEFPSAYPDSVARWVVGLGPDAEVLGPPEFRAAVRRHCEKVLKAHAARGAR
ncbi:MAG: WYL domain-containing protein, partial [Planctomycetes bacterium]|nr:WYL domain-containing protein [Planctomycetota bacterium]